MLRLNQFIKAKNYVGEASFFHVLPEQATQFLKHPEIQKLMDENIEKTSNFYKHQMYSSFFNFEPREKFTGFEAVSELDSQYRTKLKEIYGEPSDFNRKIDIDLQDNNSTSLTVKETCINAAKEIERRANGKQIFLCFSGGIDSEFAANCLLEAGVPFKAFIMNYSGKNNFDIDYAHKWCKKNNVEIVEEIIDLEKFFKEELMDYADFSKVTSPQILTYHKMISIINEKYDGYPVLGGELRFIKTENNELYFRYAGGEKQPE